MEAWLRQGISQMLNKWLKCCKWQLKNIGYLLNDRGNLNIHYQFGWLAIKYILHLNWDCTRVLVT